MKRVTFLLLLGFVFFVLFNSFKVRQDFEQSVSLKEIPALKATTTAIVEIVNGKNESIKKPTTVILDVVSQEGQVLENDNSHVYYKVVKIVDGDTIDILVAGKVNRLRLLGINTPEIVDSQKTVECFGREASNNVHKLLDGQEIYIEPDLSQDNKDKYGRLLRYVWRRDGLFYNLEAIKNGYALEYTFIVPYKYQAEFKRAQKDAEENKLGLWADGACGQENIGLVEENSSRNNQCLIKGNISATGDKVYHLANCPYYRQTKINENQGERWFCTEVEAVAAGWRKAKNCP